MSGIWPTPSGRARRVAESIAILWLLCLSDLIFTLWAHRFTPFYELNPIARAMLQLEWVAGLVLFKMGATGMACAIFWRLRQHRQVEATLWVMVSLYIVVLLRWSNYTVATAMLGMAG